MAGKKKREARWFPYNSLYIGYAQLQDRNIYKRHIRLSWQVNLGQRDEPKVSTINWSFSSRGERIEFFIKVLAQINLKLLWIYNPASCSSASAHNLSKPAGKVIFCRNPRDAGFYFETDLKPKTNPGKIKPVLPQRVSSETTLRKTPRNELRDEQHCCVWWEHSRCFMSDFQWS